LVPLSESVLPESFPFQLTEEFRTTFSQDGSLVLPSSFNLPYWRKTVGDPAWEKELIEVEEANTQAIAEHEIEVTDLTAENERRSESNRKRQRDYDAESAVYRKQLAELPARELQARQKAAEQVKQQCLDRLSRTLNEQSGAIDQALLHARDIANEEKRTSSFAFYIKVVLAIGFLSFPTIWGTSICACLAYKMRLALNKKYRRRLAEILNTYNDSSSFVKTSHKRVLFLLRETPFHASMETPVHSPVHLTDADNSWRNGGRNHREEFPLGKHNPANFAKPESLSDDLFELLSLCWFAFPGIGLIGMVLTAGLQEDDLKDFILRKVNRDSIKRHREETLSALLLDELNRPEVLNPLIDEQLRTNLLAHPTPLEEPKRPSLELMLQPPAPPSLRAPERLEPPSWCFDTEERSDFSHVLKSSLLHTEKHVGLLSRYRVFEDNRVRPYFMFGGVPIPLTASGPHKLVVGTAGSGKTTTILRLMSSLLPLTRRQAERIVSRAPKAEERLPASGDEWSRSRTHQAVVFNAKGEYLNYLKAFGFDQDVDLFSFDPTDPNGYAWDVAADIDDRTSIEQFAEQLIPQNSSAKRDDALEMWLSTARGAVVAAIVSLRNAAHAAGRQPDWNLRDLVQAFSTDDTLQSVLQWHDTPVEVLSRYFKLAGPQQSSIFVTLREAIGRFSIVANRWHDLQQRGRIISLKHWARHCSHSVLLLPNTKANVQAYSPLNATLLKALTNIVLQHEYSFYHGKNGKPQSYKRQFIFDEVGHAGKLHDIDRLMGEGRSFGIDCVLGLHQLSQLQETYGEHLADSIIGLCSYRAFLKAGDTKTAEWMSKYVGNCLRAYEKKAYTYGTSQSKSFTTTEQNTIGSSQGENQATTKGTSHGTSESYGKSESHSNSQQSSVSSGLGRRPSTTRGTSETEGRSLSESHTHNESTQESVTEGTSLQMNESTSSSHSQGTSDTTSNSQSDSTELRGEAAIEPHEFLNFPDPAVSGTCEGVYISPSLPVWRTQLTIDEMEPRYEFPERLDDWPAKRSKEEDERVSKSMSWTAEDIARLSLDRPTNGLTTSAIGWADVTTALIPPEDAELSTGEPDAVLGSQSPADDESEDEQPPQADFDF